MNLCDIKTVKNIMEAFGLRFRKEFGQNFLTNPMVVGDIADSCTDDASDSILEIGPGIGTLTRELCARYKQVLALEIDPLGLDPVDHRMLGAIIENYNGGPVGLETLAATIGEEAVTLEDVYEPYLMQLGFLTRTPRGRCVTPLAYEHLHIPMEGQTSFNI